MFYLSDLFEEISGKSRSSWKIDRGERQDNKHVRTGFSHLVVSFATPCLGCLWETYSKTNDAQRSHIVFWSTEREALRIKLGCLKVGIKNVFDTTWNNYLMFLMILFGCLTIHISVHMSDSVCKQNHQISHLTKEKIWLESNIDDLQVQ